jgi:hypothetical protein
MRRPESMPRVLWLALSSLALVGLVAVIWWLLPPARRGQAALIIGLLIVVSACILRLPAWLVARDTSVHELKADQLASAVNGARSALVQGLVGLLALTGIVVAWQQLSADRERSRNDREQFSEQLSLTREQLSLTRQAQVAEQLTGALEQLASQTLEVRLGGIYARVPQLIRVLGYGWG